MAGLAHSGARDAESTTAASSYNGYDTRRYLYWWKGTCDLYSEAIREVGHLWLCLEATQAVVDATEGETSATRAMLFDADARVVGTVLLSEQNLLSMNILFSNNHLPFLHGN